MAISATHLNDAIGVGLSSLSVNPTTLGDCVCVTVTTFSTQVITPTLSGGGALTWIACPKINGTSSAYYQFIGKVTTTGSQTLTVSWSTSIGSIQVELEATQFTDGAAREWTMAAQGSFQNNSVASTTMTYPTITAVASGGNQAYYGYSTCSTTANSGTDGNGFIQVLLATAANGDASLSGPVSAGATVTPTGTCTSGTSKSVGIIIEASNIRTKGIILNQSVKMGSLL